MGNFLQKIQESSSQTKRQVLFISSFLAMVVVGYAWLFYFNSLIVSYSPPDTTPQESATQVASRPPSFFGTMERGSAVILNRFTHAMQGIVNALRGTQEYTIKP